MNPFFLFLIGFISLAIIDFVWLKFIMKPLFIAKAGQHLSMKAGELAPSWGHVIAVWALLVAGILMFVVYPFSHEPFFKCIIRAGFFGGVVYGIYEMTNYAILANWPLDVAFYDTAWGVILCSLVAAILYYAVQY